MFAPQLYIDSGINDVSFYEKALGAVERNRRTNNDGSVHVVEFAIGDLLFHLHEANRSEFISPVKNNVTTVKIGLFVTDVDSIMRRAEAAGAKILSPAKDYEYGYRQGEFKDPFGHHWLIEKKI
jgi:PhnB protein